MTAAQADNPGIQDNFSHDFGVSSARVISPEHPPSLRIQRDWRTRALSRFSRFFFPTPSGEKFKRGGKLRRTSRLDAGDWEGFLRGLCCQVNGDFGKDVEVYCRLWIYICLVFDIIFNLPSDAIFSTSLI